MHRVDTNGAVAGLFDAGDPAIPRLPTQVDAPILNAFQEEIANTITNAGIALVKGTNTQLRDAVVNILTNQTIAGLKAFLGTLAGELMSVTNLGTGWALKVIGNSTAALNNAALNVVNNSTGPALNVTSAGAKAAAFATLTDTVADAAVELVKGGVRLLGVNPASADAHTNQLTPLGLVKGWAHFAWSLGAPTLASGMNMAAPGNPAAGQIQVNLNGTALTNAMVVIGNAGAGAWKVVPLGIAGLIQIQDNAGVAVPFGTTTGFAFVVVFGRQVNAG